MKPSKLPTVHSEDSRRKAVMNGAPVEGKLTPAIAAKIRLKVNSKESPR